ncbi:hypothetical protein CLAFUW4_14411 [Fulvia fulva]|uniref:uncharacterized protein n=1 Tax=Passalora fulva TaxID=5499 RepID=UPI0028528FE3|nr:uncharacterized protein CLAFUR5_20380 [Fulvia fulva]WMI39095.1 hypothetical protein CLAFUR5_20380 [Fulvia fulva]WPV22662.1 hypothetical protein CLAFUW4_14411 [Fulvia fulva]
MADHSFRTKRRRREAEAQENVNKLLKLSEEDVIYVKVGEFEPKTFLVHKDAFCKQSPFFKDFCETNIRHHGRLELILSSTLPEIFEKYMSLVYTKHHKLDEAAEASEGLQAEHPRYNKRKLYIRTMVNLWLTEANSIRVTLGDRSKDACIVHGEIIRERSGLFSAARSSHRPDECMNIDLPNVHPQVFQQYVDWLYNRSTELETDLMDIFHSTRIEDSGCNQLYKYDANHSKVHAVVDLWSLGAMLRDFKFQDQAMRSFFRLKTPWTTKCKALQDQVLYHCTPNSALRRLFLDLLNRRLAIDRVEEADMESLPKDVLVHLLKRPATRNWECEGEQVLQSPEVESYLDNIHEGHEEVSGT